MKKKKVKNELIKESLNILRDIFKENYINTWTNNYEPSVHHSILMHENQPILDDDIELINVLKGKRFNLEIYISRLTNVFYYYVLETIYKNDKLDFKLYDAVEFLNIDKANLISKRFMEAGYYSMERSIANIIVPNIETELHYEGDVKIFHCLFSDIEQPF